MQARRRSVEAVLRAREETHVQRLFERFDMPPRRRLRDAERPRRTRQRAFAQHREERPVKLPAYVVCHTFLYIRSTKFVNFIARAKRGE